MAGAIGKATELGAGENPVVQTAELGF